MTPGGTGRLAGDLPKFDRSDLAQGIFFLAGDQSETRVEVVDRNTSGQLSFLVPALAAGAYRLEVRTVLNSGQELHKGELKAVLTVS